MATPPKGAKRPADRKPKAPAEVDGNYVVTVHGESWTISKEALDDFELFEDIGEIDKGNPARLPSALKRLLGSEQYPKAMDTLRDPETGRVGMKDGLEFFSEVFEALPNS